MPLSSKFSKKQSLGRSCSFRLNYENSTNVLSSFKKKQMVDDSYDRKFHSRREGSSQFAKKQAKYEIPDNRQTSPFGLQSANFPSSTSGRLKINDFSTSAQEYDSKEKLKFKLPISTGPNQLDKHFKK